jgi:hypothetical protein
MHTLKDNKRGSNQMIDEYKDELHAEVLDDIQTAEYGYKYRLLEGIVMPPYITPERYKLSRNLELRTGDVCFISYPKSGSTWLSHILVLMLNNGETPADTTLRNSVHWVASSWPYPRSREELDALPSPRIFKSHMPWHMAVGGNTVTSPCKYIYIARNPKDVSVSYYHFESGKQWSGNYSGPWEHWLKWFLEGKVQRGDWFNHVLSWWEHKDDKNVLFLKYEDMKRDFDNQLDRIAGFLEYPLPDSTKKLIRDKSSFENMKKDDFSNLHEIPELGSFFRKGQIGSWKDMFTVAQSEQFDRIYKDRMRGTGLEFDFV